MNIIYKYHEKEFCHDIACNGGVYGLCSKQS